MEITETPYQTLRIQLLQRGYSLRSFAKEFGYETSTIYAAARGTRAGKVTLPIRLHLERFVRS